jgi:hypothetical protein
MDDKERKSIIVGAPFSLGQEIQGVELGPDEVSCCPFASAHPISCPLLLKKSYSLLKSKSHTNLPIILVERKKIHQHSEFIL